VKRILLIALLVTGYVAASAAADSNSEFDKLYSQASQQATGAAVPQMFFELAQHQAEEGGSSFNNMGQLANYLADDFSLYSNLHSDVIQSQCKAEGANISAYLAALAQQDEPDEAVARKIYARLGNNYEKIWLRLRPQALRDSTGLVTRFAGILHVPPNSFCAQLVNDPNGSARGLAYSSVRASRSQVLRAISP
jgi:hypothetical protein